MNDIHLREILSKPEFANKTNQECIDYLLADSNEYKEQFIHYADIVDNCLDGGELLNKIEEAAESLPNVRWSMVDMGTIGLDIGSPAKRTLIQDLVHPHKKITQIEADSLLNLAEKKKIYETYDFTMPQHIGHLESAIKLIRGNV